MSRRQHFDKRRTPWPALFVTALLIGGVAYAVNDTSRPLFGNQSFSTTSTTSSATTVHVTGTRFEVGIRAPESDRDSRILVDITTKTVSPEDVPSGWRVESLDDARGTLRITSSEDRGFVLTDGGEWNVTLRSANGEAYTEPRLLGMSDEKHAIVLARTDRSQLLYVSRVGQVIKLSDVPENANVFGLSGGAIWLATFIPGEGLESEPSGPSTLFKISLSGQQEIVDSTKTSELFLGALSDGMKRAAWTNGGRFFANSDGRDFNGPGLPLAWLDGALLVAESEQLFLYDNFGQKEDLGVKLSGRPVVARGAP